MIIAEIGTSHEGNAEKARALIDAACRAGADAVKFQWVYADEILHPDTGFVALPTGNIPLYERFKALECPPTFFSEMKDYAHEKGVKFGCSPFGLRSLEELCAVCPDFIKIASPELNHFPLLRALASFRAEQKQGGAAQIPVIISSGVSTLNDIEKALFILGTDGVTLLHCITSYPAPESEYNVRLVSTLSGIFGVPCGISDHSLDPLLVPCLSVMCGGTVIEKHITLSKQTDGLDDPVALEEEAFALMVHGVHQTEASLRRYGKEFCSQSVVRQLAESYGEDRVRSALGDGVKRLAPAERDNYGRTNRSLHYLRPLLAGQTVCAKDVAVLRTEKVLTPGVSPEFLETVVGSVLCRDVASGAGVRLEDFISRLSGMP